MRYVKILMVWISILSFNNVLFASEKGDFQVIVHVTNPHVRLTRKEISNLFLKKITRWKETNELIYPVDQLKDSLVREQFSRAIHRKKISAIKAYWQQQIFSGREIPPVEKASDEEVLKYVAQKAGTVGYVSASADINRHNVKIIEIVEK